MNLNELGGALELSAQDDLRVIGIDLGTTNSTVCELIHRKGEDRPGSPVFCGRASESAGRSCLTPR